MSERVKPWEETWTESEVWTFDQDDSPFDEVCTRVKLAAAAPEMARLLLDLEWMGEPGGYRCPSCADYHRHRPNCRLVAVLRKAGVLL